MPADVVRAVGVTEAGGRQQRGAGSGGFVVVADFLP